MSHIRIKNEYFRTPEFIEFNKRVKSTVYFFLLSAVIRESELTKDTSFGGHYIYKEHYLKGDLVCRYSQDRIAEYLQTSQPRVSRYLAQLEQDELIKILRRPTQKGMISYYQVGVWTGDIGKDSYHETLWFDTIFSALYETAKAYRDEKRKTHPDPDKRQNIGERMEIMQKYYQEEFIMEF